MERIRTEDAVGHILCHDLTQIIKDETKGVLFKKGHVIRKEDIEPLLNIGKAHLYVWTCDAHKLHEDEAAEILYEVCAGDYVERKGETKEGKIELIASCDGMLHIDVDKLNALNSYEEIVVATRHHRTPIKKGDTLAGMRVVPLVIDQKKMSTIQETYKQQPLISVKPYKAYKVGMVTTGSEIFHGRIKDAFGPVIKEKLAAYNIAFLEQKIVDDQVEAIQEAVKALIAKGATMIICTGGMSVDPDDVTPTALAGLGGECITYGAPVLPGAMFMLAYIGDIPVVGLPGCVMYAKRTVFDLVFPYILTGQKLTRKDITKLGHGGLCLGCSTCHFPNCSFGKGV